MKAIPSSFCPLASVPLQEPATAVKELERAAKLGLRGVEIPPKIVERQLDEPDFEVFWAAAEALQMAVCIHPFEAAPVGAMSRYFLGNLVGNLYDTGLAAALLIYGGVLERHPALQHRALSCGRHAADHPRASRHGLSPGARMPEGDSASAVELRESVSLRHHRA